MTDRRTKRVVESHARDLEYLLQGIEAIVLDQTGTLLYRFVLIENVTFSYDRRKDLLIFKFPLIDWLID